MRNKYFFLIIILGMFLLIASPIISASQDSFFKKTISSITGNVIEEGDGVQRNGNFITGFRYKDYVSENETLIIDDGRNVLAKVKLISPILNKVSPGEDILVAEFLFEEFDLDSNRRVMNDVEFFNRKENMNKLGGKTFILKYLNNGNWIEFERFSDLPSKNIRVGLFTDTNFGESVEWIPEMFNFIIEEWASYEVILSETQDLGVIHASYNRVSAFKVDGNHSLVAYSGTDGDGYVQLTRSYDNGTIQKSTALEFDADYYAPSEPSFGKIDDSHYLLTYHYGGVRDKGVVVTAYTNNLTVYISDLTVLDTGPTNEAFNAIEKMDTDTFLRIYSKGASGAYAQVIHAYSNGTIVGGSGVQYSSSQLMKGDLEKIDINYYLVSSSLTTSHNAGAIVLAAYTNETVTPIGTSYNFDTDGADYNQLHKYNDTHYLNLYSEGIAATYDGIRNFLVVDLGDYSISSTTEVTFDSGAVSDISIENVSDDVFLMTYYNSTDAIYELFQVTDNLDFVNLDENVFSSELMGDNSLVELDNNYFVNFWANSTDHIYGKIILVNETTLFNESENEQISTNLNSHNSLFKVNESRILNVYDQHSIGGGTGYARTLDFNSSWNVQGIPRIGESFTTGGAEYNVLAQINDTHYIVVYQGTFNDGFARVLEVLDNGTVTFPGSVYEWETIDVYYNDIAKIDDNHFLVTYAYGGASSAGYAIVLTAYANGTISKGTRVAFDATRGIHNSLEKIDANHFLNTYAGELSDGYAVVITAYANGTIAVGTAHEFETATANYNSLEKINDTHYLNSYSIANTGGSSVVLEVNQADWTVSTVNSAKAFSSDGSSSDHLSLRKINSYQFLLIYGKNSDNLGYFRVIDFNSTNLNLSYGGLNVFESAAFDYSSLENGDSSHLVSVYSGQNNYGYAKVFSFLGASSDTCTCAGSNTNWAIALTDYCVISSDCDLGTGILSFTGAGNATISAAINTSNMTAPGSGGTLYVTRYGRIYVG